MFQLLSMAQESAEIFVLEYFTALDESIERYISRFRHYKM